MLPTPPTMRMLENYQMTGAMMDNNWRQYANQLCPRVDSLSPEHARWEANISRCLPNLTTDECYNDYKPLT